MVKNVYINNIKYDIEDGLSIKETATEELDSCIIQIANIHQLSLEPMQSVVIEFDNNTKKYFIVNTWVDEPSTFDTNLKNYMISCISETKKLERVQLPNRTITQPLTKQNKKNYYYYAENIFYYYVKKLYPELTIDAKLKTLLEEQIAVEEVFNSTSAKDFFNIILEKYTKLIKVENNVLTSFDITNKGYPINTDDLFFTTTEEKIEDYYNQIRTDLQNVQSEDSTIITEIVGMRAPDEAFLTTDNAIIKLSHNINYIKEIICYVHAKIGTNEKQFIKAKINSDKRRAVVEKAEYDLYKVSNLNNYFDDDLKRMHLYYTRGKNTIEGFAYDEGRLLDKLTGKTPLINIITKMMGEAGYTDIPEKFDDIRDVKFEITYSALDDVSVKFNKTKTFNSEIRDNQNESYIDLDKFAKNEQLKLNRIGNPSISIASRYDNIENIPNLFDYIGDYILAEKEVVYHNEFIDFKGTLYKNYINRDIFYGVNAKKRTTPLITGNEAVVRKELTKFKYYFSFDNDTGANNTTRYLLGKLAATNYQIYDQGEVVKPNFMTMKDFRPIALAVGTSTLDDFTTISYKLEPDVRKAGNSVLINFKFEDNINVGIQQSDIKIGGYTQKYVPYTDNNGELDYITIHLYDKTKLSHYETNGDYYGLSNSTFDYPDKFPEIDENIIDYNSHFFSCTLYRYKDQREILNETLQLEFEGSNGIFVNDRFIDMLPFF